MQKVRTDTTGEFQRETTFQLNAPAETARVGSNAGKSVAVFPWTTDFGNNVATVAVSNDSVIITSAYNQAAMCRLKITLGGAVKVWKNEKLARQTVMSKTDAWPHIVLAGGRLFCRDRNGSVRCLAVSSNAGGIK
ncbi:MAG: hypothetical protein GY904_14275 [Planctomycetaceae bacterium]|nr:hypothetical protein [Planctomycetaceae bacterium]